MWRSLGVKLWSMTNWTKKTWCNFFFETAFAVWALAVVMKDHKEAKFSPRWLSRLYSVHCPWLTTNPFLLIRLETRSRCWKTTLECRGSISPMVSAVSLSFGWLSGLGRRLVFTKHVCPTLFLTSLAAGQHCGLRLPRVLLDQGAGEHGEERRHAVAHLLGGLRSLLCRRVLRRLHRWLGWFWIVLCLKLSSTNSSRCLSTGSRNAFSLSGAWLQLRLTALTWSTPSETFIKILLEALSHRISFWPGWFYHSSLSTRATSTELSPRLR